MNMPRSFIIFLFNLINHLAMFPNDDICNIDVAKSAAQRLFRKYRNRSGQQEGGLGKNQINRLMKATYEAINMPYDPNEQDVFSFMGVFDSNNDGKIELQDLEDMAVKYLCGTEALMKQATGTRLESLKERVKKEEEARREQESTVQQKSVRLEKIQKQPIKQEEKPKKKLTIEIAEPEEVQTSLQRIYTPSASLKAPTSFASYYSPKQRISFKDSFSSANTEATSMKSQFNTPKQKLSQAEVLQKGKEIFLQHSDTSRRGLIESSAGKVLSQTYQLFGKKNFNPSQEDIKIWMKLCDKNKDSIVEWQDYEYFLVRTFQRESQKIN